MNIFQLLAPATYWLLIVLWAYILFSHIKRFRLRRGENQLLITLIIVLAIDAFRTLFESIYFGAWYTSLAGLMPIAIHDFLVRPEIVIIPKLINLVAASTVIIILLRRWFPAEENERHQQEKHMREMAETIAGLKETKELVRRSRDEFEMRLMEKTAELNKTADKLQNEFLVRQEMEAELQTAIEKVERTNSEFEQFSYVVSHDLQEPLRMISSYMQLLERRYRGQLDDDAHEFIDFAVDGAKRMQILIADLLAYSRVGTRGKPFEPTDSGRVLDQTLTNFGELIAENGATVTHDALPTVMADGVQLTQVFQSLLSNAIKFQGDASPEIHFGAERMNGEWLFSVRDNGIGIESEYFEKIFVIFRRLHTGQEYPGTGIGLAISKRIIERHGGRIWAESEPGKGATFHFTIPDGT